MRALTDILDEIEEAFEERDFEEALRLTEELRTFIEQSQETGNK